MSSGACSWVKNNFKQDILTRLLISTNCFKIRLPPLPKERAKVPAQA
jgi:hypothetical protein